MVSVSFDPFTPPEVATGFVAAPLFILLFLASVRRHHPGRRRDLVHAGQQPQAARAMRVMMLSAGRSEARRLREAPPVVVGPAVSTIPSAGAQRLRLTAIRRDLAVIPDDGQRETGARSLLQSFEKTWSKASGHRFRVRLRRPGMTVPMSGPGSP